MGILNYIPTLTTDTLTIFKSSQDVIFHSCSDAATQLDVEITKYITSSILLGIAIIGIIIVLCFAIAAVSRYKEQRLRYKFEENKRKDEQELQKFKNRMDLSWRCLNDFYKKKESGVTDREAKLAEASWDFLASSINEFQKKEQNHNK